MGRLLIRELVGKVLFYFSLSISGIFKRRKMNTNYHCNVFAGEEEVTPRSKTPVESPDPVLDAPELLENGVVLDINTNEPGEPLTTEPVDDIMPWCPTPKSRSSRKRNSPPAVKAYASHASPSPNPSRGARKRLQTKRTTQKKRRIPVKGRRLARRGPPAISVAHRNHRQVNASEPAAMTPESHHSTPKSSRMRSSARKRPASSPAAGHRSRSNHHSGSLNIPRTFIVTIDEVKGER